VIRLFLASQRRKLFFFIPLKKGGTIRRQAIWFRLFALSHIFFGHLQTDVNHTGCESITFSPAILTEWGSSQFMYVGEAPKKKIS
jgi:hypothetical protein